MLTIPVTVAALQQFDAALGSADPGGVSEALFTKLYLSIPVTREAFGKRQRMNEYFAKMQHAAPEPEERKATAKTAKKETPAVSQKQTSPAVEAAQAAPQPQEVAQAAPEPVVQKKAAPAAAGHTTAPVVAAAADAAAPTPAAVSPPAAAAAKPKKFGRQLSADEW